MKPSTSITSLTCCCCRQVTRYLHIGFPTRAPRCIVSSRRGKVAGESMLCYHLVQEVLDIPGDGIFLALLSSVSVGVMTATTATSCLTLGTASASVSNSYGFRPLLGRQESEVGADIVTRVPPSREAVFEHHDVVYQARREEGIGRLGRRKDAWVVDYNA